MLDTLTPERIGSVRQHPGALTIMIQYDPHRWSDHLFDVKGSLIPEITLRVLVVRGLGGRGGGLRPYRPASRHPGDDAHAGGSRLGAAPGVPHQLLVRPVLGRPAAVGEPGQRVAEPGPCRRGPSQERPASCWTSDPLDRGVSLRRQERAARDRRTGPDRGRSAQGRGRTGSSGPSILRSPSRGESPRDWSRRATRA